MPEILYPEESYAIQGACFEVCKGTGHGLVEPVYQECVEIELGLRGISFEAQKTLPLPYKGAPLKQSYRADLTCFGKIIVGMKAVSAIVDEFRSQALCCLNAAVLRLGILVNFGIIQDWNMNVLWYSHRLISYPSRVNSYELA